MITNMTTGLLVVSLIWVSTIRLLLEYENEAEVNVREMVFEETDTPEEVALKSSVLSIYNKVLDRRLMRKAFMFSRGLTDFKRIQALEKRRARDARHERDAVVRSRPFARLLTPEDYEIFEAGLVHEAALTVKVEKLQEYRKMGLKNKSDISQYEKDKKVYAFSYLQ
jgi:transcriptional adapter 2-alpha